MARGDRCAVMDMKPFQCPRGDMVQAEQQLLSTSSRVNELQQELDCVRESDRVHSIDATQHAEAAAQLRCQRDSLQDHLAAAQGTLGSTAAEVETLRGQVCHACCTFISTYSKAVAWSRTIVNAVSGPP